MAPRVSKLEETMRRILIDDCTVYRTETELGTAIKESGVPRENLYVVTKVIENVKDIENALRTSLKKLQTNYVDL